MFTSLLSLLPVELFETILFHISSTKDLLNLALTCRKLCSFIIPYHIDYREIVCSTADNYLWEHLLNRQNLAKRIHSVVIRDNYQLKYDDKLWRYETESGSRQVIPRILQIHSQTPKGWKDSDVEHGLSLKTFGTSFSVMRNLYSFEYSGPCPVTLLYTHLAHSSPELRVFKYLFRWSVRPDWVTWGNLIDAKIHRNKGFSNLECCSINTYFAGRINYNERDVVTMIDSLGNNHSLTSLTLNLRKWETPVETILLLRPVANWPKLHTLSLGRGINTFPEGTDLQSRSMLARSFFSRHSSLERLQGLDIPIYPGTIQPDMLLKLHTLSISSEYPISDLIPEDVAARLVNLSVNLDSNVSDSFISPNHFKNVRRLFTTISLNRLPSLLETIPNIERLRVWVKMDATAVDSPVIQKSGVLHLLPIFTKHNKSLTHLSLTLPFDVEDGAIEEYACQLRELVYIKVRPILPLFEVWYKITRSSSGEVTLERYSEESDDNEVWKAHLWLGLPKDY